MPWGRIDDRFYRHAKVAELDDGMRKGAIALYWLAVSWCNDELTDGRVPVGAIRLLGGDKAEADELVRVGLWERDGKAYRVHDFLQFNQSAERVREVRDVRSHVGRTRAAYRWDAAHAPAQAYDEASLTHASVDASADGPVSRLPSPVLPETPPPASEARADDAVVAFYEVTAKVPTGRALSWLNELATDHGEEAVCAAIRRTDPDPMKTFLSRVQLALTSVTVGERSASGPTTEDEFFASQAAKRRPAQVLDELAAKLTEAAS